MYRRATTGLEENNNKFSNCSMEKMGPVVIAVKNQLAGKVNCLTGIKKNDLNKKRNSFCFILIECLQVGYCGNRNVEDDEECDCGFISECTDDCCYPAGGPDAKLGCKLKPGARCRLISTKISISFFNFNCNLVHPKVHVVRINVHFIHLLIYVIKIRLVKIVLAMFDASMLKLKK